MKPRHLQMIAVGGSIGTGLFGQSIDHAPRLPAHPVCVAVGSGQALRNGGPAGVLIAWTLIGIVRRQLLHSHHSS